MQKVRILGLATTLVASLMLMTGCALLDNHSNLTIATVMEDAGESSEDVTTNPRDITEDECPSTSDCIEAYSTDEANYYRFSTREEAKTFADSLDDGFVSHYIVMNFAGKTDTTKLSQQRAMERLASTWQDDEGTFPDRD